MVERLEHHPAQFAGRVPPVAGHHEPAVGVERAQPDLQPQRPPAGPRLAAAYSAADLLVLPSPAEGCGLVVDPWLTRRPGPTGGRAAFRSSRRDRTGSGTEGAGSDIVSERGVRTGPPSEKLLPARGTAPAYGVRPTRAWRVAFVRTAKARRRTIPRVARRRALATPTARGHEVLR